VDAHHSGILVSGVTVKERTKMFILLPGTQEADDVMMQAAPEFGSRSSAQSQQW
ncbi:hypothetical protein L9F63_011460, partial [Diploptera punctata]